ncbi:MAG: hypothetical protein KA821_02770 [Chitinophagaceae bacterium]|nr:hypothetical protein [Chitinophagaceae bacterium]
MKKEMLFIPLLAFLAVMPACTRAQNPVSKPGTDHAEPALNGQKNTPPKNHFNTATTKIAGKECSLTLIGDMLPDFSVDGRKVSTSDFDDYASEIDSLSHIIWERQRKEAQRREAAIAKIKQQILGELVSAKHITTQSQVHSFYLSSEAFFINNKQQSPEVFAYFKKKYLKSEDKAFYYENR